MKPHSSTSRAQKPATTSSLKDAPFIEATVLGHADGFGFARPRAGGEDIYLPAAQMHKVFHGDSVSIQVTQTTQRGHTGEVVAVTVEKTPPVIGRYHPFTPSARDGSNHYDGYIEPHDRRVGHVVYIPNTATHVAQAGDMVVARVLDHPFNHPQVTGEVTEVLGAEIDSTQLQIQLAVHQHQLPHEWSEAVLAATAAIPTQIMGDEANRVDLRALPFVTIDGDDAKDYDDAIYCETTETGWRLVVAIADVSHYVHADSALDHAAFARGNSVYFPWRVLPMLPAPLSNGICSLLPLQDRNALVCEVHIDATGKACQSEFYRAHIQSRARLTYAWVDQILAGSTLTTDEAIILHVHRLHELAQQLHGYRHQHGAVDFSRPEPAIEFDAEHKIKSIAEKSRTAATGLVEECMLVANVCAAQLLHAAPKNESLRASIYRVHRGPEQKSLVELRQFLDGLGLTLGGRTTPSAADYSQLLDHLADRPAIRSVVTLALLRSLGQAIYSTESLGHFALAYPLYTHFTSPIRRYTDLIVHRQIKACIDARARAITPADVSLAQIGEHCSMTERRADQAVYQIIAWLKAEFMQDKIGEQFDGVIVNVTEFGIFVQLTDIFVDGLVHVSVLGRDYFDFDTEQRVLVGARTGYCFSMGDLVRVQVVEVLLDTAKINFHLVPQTRSGETSPTKPRARRRRARRR